MAFREERRPNRTTTDRSHVPRKRSSAEVIEKLSDGRVRMGSEVGLTIPVADTTAHIRFSFWHERLAKNDSQEELKRTAALIDEFNEAEIERRVRKYQRLVRRVETDDEDDEPTQGARARSRRRRNAPRSG